jgi:arsenate reductase
MDKRRVLFLCTGNSARSQMAQGLVNRFMRGQWEAYSAGTNPAGYVHPLAIQVMAELGIDISTQRSKSVSEFRDIDFDLVIAVCDDAAQNCPLWLGGGQMVRIGFPDPAALETGAQDGHLALFQQVRDDIRKRVLRYLTNNVEYEPSTPDEEV